ncbi:N-acetyl-lysine deacetylase [Ignisphaera sp. 4213-co]|uniref:Putative [LysW]-lysine/[LysW]-ornithine hydrolase n=1 Tax=Ignisphaera cupida TaxID=3050454 RepID=A0ABD4Z7D7_9CREN|nr:N-acetyl-lysine deacetylase [Ignisphaera sp. 4213-co]MDK6029144.1 N-acetyl-lysine deacetylase [Ignisphaera sp. 4213-co]
MVNALRNLAVDMLLDIVKAYSPTGAEEKAVKILYEYAKTLGFDKITIDNVGNLIAEIGYGEKSLALIGHIDTVPGEIPVEYNGYSIKGRGAVDAKGPLTAMFIAASLAKRGIDLNKHRIVVVAAVGEEGDSIGAKELLKKGFKANGIVIGEPSNNSIVIGYRGGMRLEITCKSRPSHTSSPPIEPSACDKIIGIWSKIREMYNTYTPQSNSATAIHISCGENSRFNVYPTHAILIVDVRISVSGSVEAIEKDVLNIVKQYNECFQRVVDFTPPIKVSVNNTVVRALTRALLKTNTKPRFVYKLGTSDMNILAACANNNIVAYGPGKSQLSHTDEEEIAVDELLQGIDIYTKTILEFFNILD